MGNCQNICQIGLTTDSADRGQDLDKYFLGQRQQNRLQIEIKEEIATEQQQQKNNNDTKVSGTQTKFQYYQKEDNSIMDRQLNDKQNRLTVQPFVEQKFIKIKTTLWNKDSHSLFDYENNDKKQSILKIKTSGSISLNKDQIIYFKKNRNNQITLNPETHDVSINLNSNNPKFQNDCGRFFLKQSFDADMRPSSQSCWIVIKSVQNQSKKGLRLIENDFIKLGRLKFKVREICESGKKVQTQIKKIIEEHTEFACDQEAITEMLTMRSAKNLEDFQLKLNSNILNSQNNGTKNSGSSPSLLNYPNQGVSSQLKQKSEEAGTFSIYSQQGQQINNQPTQQNLPSKADLGTKENSGEGCFQPMCKICLSEHADIDNPFVNPCKCTGSMKFVHIKCIQYWVRSKIQNSHANDNCIILLSKFFECELCKTKYHFKFNSEGQMYDIVEYSKPDDGSPYLILESFSGSKMQSFGVYILRLSGKNNFTIGRAHDADIRVSDISVSRQHASLIYDSETRQLFIKDYESKFGSLVMMRDDLELTPDLDRIQIQNGRSLLEIIYDNNQSSIFSTCLGQQNENEGIEVISEQDDDDDKSFYTQCQDV